MWHQKKSVVLNFYLIDRNWNSKYQTFGPHDQSCINTRGLKSRDSITILDLKKGRIFFLCRRKNNLDRNEFIRSHCHRNQTGSSISIRATNASKLKSALESTKLMCLKFSQRLTNRSTLTDCFTCMPLYKLSTTSYYVACQVNTNYTPFTIMHSWHLINQSC